MGSHYIPVGKIKIDKDILDIVCPAAGYDNTPPPPEIYCPAEGYEKIEEGWEPPFVPIEIDVDEILLICDDGGFGFIYSILDSNGGNGNCALYDSDGVLLSNIPMGKNLAVKIVFPTQNTGTYYQCVISSPPGANITKFSMQPQTPLKMEYNIHKIIVNAPQLVTFDNVTKDNFLVKEVEFIGSCDNLTTLTNAFQGINLRKVTLPKSMSALTSFNNTFRHSALKIIDLRGYQFPNLSSISGAFADLNAHSILLPEMPNLTTIANAFNNTKVKNFEFQTSLPFVTIATNCFSNFQCPDYELKFTNLDSMGASGLAGAFAKTYVKKIIFDCDIIAPTSLLIFNDNLAEEIVLPDKAPNVTLFSVNNSAPRLRKITLPTQWKGTALTAAFNCSILEEIVNLDYLPPSTKLDIYSSRIKEVDAPNLVLWSIRVGISNTVRAPVSEVNVDWSNFDYSSSATGMTINANLDATELDRIMTLLPANTNNAAIDIRYNAGYSTCDKTIAQNKGWRVL